MVVLGVDDMGLGLNGSERLRTLTVGEEGKGREEIGCVFGGCTLLRPRNLWQCSGSATPVPVQFDFRRSGRSYHDQLVVSAQRSTIFRRLKLWL